MENFSKGTLLSQRIRWHAAENKDESKVKQWSEKLRCNKAQNMKQIILSNKRNSNLRGYLQIIIPIITNQKAIIVSRTMPKSMHHEMQSRNLDKTLTIQENSQMAK